MGNFVEIYLLLTDVSLHTDRPHGCCAVPPPGIGSEACLIPLRSDETPRCVEAPGLLVPTETVVTRCERSCVDGQTCVRLRQGEQFLRIGVQSADQESVVLWRGQRQEIYRDGMIHRGCTPDCYMLIADPSGRYSVATTVVGFPLLAAKPRHGDYNVRTSLRSPTTTRLRPREQIHPDINTVIIFIQCSSASPTRWRNTDGRYTPSSRPYQLNRGRH